MNIRHVVGVVVLFALAVGLAHAGDCPSVMIPADHAKTVVPEGNAELSSFTLQCPQDSRPGTFHVLGSGTIKTRAKTKTGFVDASYFIVIRDSQGKLLTRKEFPTMLDFCTTCHPNGDNQQTESFDYSFPIIDGQSMKGSKLEMGWVAKKS